MTRRASHTPKAVVYRALLKEADAVKAKYPVK